MRRTARNFVGIAATMALIALSISAFAASSASAIGIGELGSRNLQRRYLHLQRRARVNSSPRPPATRPTASPTSPSTSKVGDQAKRVKVELPQGLNVNPQAVPQCPVETFKADEAACAASKVGDQRSRPSK